MPTRYQCPHCPRVLSPQGIRKHIRIQHDVPSPPTLSELAGGESAGSRPEPSEPVEEQETNEPGKPQAQQGPGIIRRALQWLK